MLSATEINNQKFQSQQLQQKLKYKEKELKYKQQELVNLALHITEKNDFLEKLKTKLTTSKKSINTEELIELITNNLSNLENDRKEFDAYIENVNQAFLLKIRELAPDITKSEERLSLLLKINLTSKEIAATTNISVKSVEIARFRLRRKLNLNKDEKINEFLKKL